ncbi:MAG: ABC transporter ATP-binding protein/permease [Burkholderiaceae bacterium]|nr:ABC transporter ATP-binding protein/permease [Burkholderiaceae bacterium]
MGQPSGLRRTLALLGQSADREVRRQLLAAAAVVTLGGVLSGLAPLALMGLVDLIAQLHQAGVPGSGPASPRMPSGVAAQAVALGLAYLGALALARLLAELRPLPSGIAEQRVHALLTRRFYAHLLQLPLDRLQSRRPGDLTQSLSLASSGCKMLLAHAVGTVLPVVVELATVLVVLSRLGQPALVVVTALAAGGYLAASQLGGPSVTRRARDVSAASRDLQALLTEGLTHGETLKCQTAEPHSIAAVAHATRVVEAGWRRLNVARVRVGLWMAGIFILATSSALMLAAEAVLRGALSAGGFVLMAAYMLQIVRPLEQLGNAARDLAQALGFVESMLQLLDQPVESSSGCRTSGIDTAALPVQPDQPVPPIPRPGTRTVHGRASASVRAALQVRGLRFGYEASRLTLDDIELDIEGGIHAAIVGPSGSGKSSLVRLLLRLHEPQAGRIALGGQDIATLPLPLLRRRIGVAPQEPVVFAGSLRTNLVLGSEQTSPEALSCATSVAQLQELVAQQASGLDSLLGPQGIRLSGGERQRLAIARLVLRQPQVCVLDEATSMLDGRTESLVLSALREALPDRTLISIAHRLDSVVACDRIHVMDRGRIVESGTHAALLARGGLYAQLWAAQHRDRCSMTPTPLINPAALSR